MIVLSSGKYKNHTITKVPLNHLLWMYHQKAPQFADAKEDSLKDHEGEYDKKVFNVGKDIVKLIRNYL